MGARRYCVADQRTVTVRRRGLGAFIARVLSGEWPTYDVAMAATALVELQDLQTPPPGMQIATRLGRPIVEFVAEDPDAFRIVSLHLHEVGNA